MINYQLVNIRRTDMQALSLKALNSKYLIEAQRNEPYFAIVKLWQPVAATVDGELHQFQKGELAFIRPGCQLDFLNAEEGDGYIFLFTASFYERSKEDSALLNSSLFFGSHPIVVIDDPLRDEQSFHQLIERLENVSQRGEVIFPLMAHHFLEALLLEGYHGLNASIYMEKQEKQLDLSLVNNFSVLVHKYYREYTSVQFYAEQLHVTPRKLTECCLAITGKSAKTLITDVLVRQALRYIRHTNLSIAQISYEMGFNDESNFRNFVKKRTGNIPRTYREN
ncbi:helix-turn-helix transcriptional regulator [Sphingobacterium thalpophilum]|uniref:Helix-turn-helix transcriptional regulator n=1 Tax=Sphingobacterium thalpophilum TaxID=259 RepID=A0ABV4HAJ2_9SPHI|nr:response regulator transcription factor [Sphingobacterium sp. InxBP1]MCW8310779.1 helix-turn-helix transcriptional regulator [Sphingobacterium sp. InxBP1]